MHLKNLKKIQFFDNSAALQFSVIFFSSRFGTFSEKIGPKNLSRPRVNASLGELMSSIYKVLQKWIKSKLSSTKNAHLEKHVICTPNRSKMLPIACVHRNSFLFAKIKMNAFWILMLLWLAWAYEKRKNQISFDY